MSMFTKATKEKAKARIALHGPSGGGKTYTALAIATGLGKRIALLDTENGSASKYADDPWSFDTIVIRPPYTAQKMIDVIRGATAEGYDVLVIDSLTHFWKGTGGVLEQVDAIAERVAARTNRRPDTHAAWKQGDAIYRSFMDEILNAQIHIIGCMRAKQSVEKGEDGKIRKMGLAPEFREGGEYEFDIEGMLDMDNTLHIGKTRMRSLRQRSVKLASPAFGEEIGAWLAAGKDVDPEADRLHPPPKVEAPPPATQSPKPESERRPAPVADSPADELLVEIAAAADLPQLAAVAARIKGDLDRKPDNARRAKLELAYGAKKKTLQAKAAPPADPPADGDPADQWDRGAA